MAGIPDSHTHEDKCSKNFTIGPSAALLRREPRIPAVGIKTPIRMREEAGVCSEVLAKRMDVDEIVVEACKCHLVKFVGRTLRICTQ